MVLILVLVLVLVIYLIELMNFQGQYGTRSTSAVVVKRGGSVSFYESYLLEKNVWKDATVNYEIETEKVA